ncbi:MAG: CDP-diacylglycerol--glycerol-3-phosphate 3-phosphatidyltransferase [Cyanobacteria bacterium]|nr:CDP-diacylglycerol--glycerol-3-phosphate 3-phosphatidyltransferase [Cyanobacteriota bacterium]MDW8199923.1 CDP-diacylglycerol--glycerol-3-phosphate 3-phosphatidyltransferase [Cyanobacteriota bacterium SKYGB_h_bin112]
MGLPTWVTISRLLAVPWLLILLPQATTSSQWWSLGIFLVAAGTDWLDGYLARRLNQVTELGKFLDPLVDKLLVMAPLLVLLEMQQVPAWAVFLILGRELAIAGWRVTPTSSPSPIQGANLWGKTKTVMQIVAIALLIAPLSPAWDLTTAISFWLAVALTLVSGITYLLPTSAAPTTSANKV